MDDLLPLRIFVQAARAGSFTAAAQQMGLTPSTVSRKVSALESALGQRLFQRTTRRQVLTEAGARFLADAERICAELDAAVEAAAAGDAAAGRLHVAAEPDMATHLLTPVLPGFLAAHPKLKLRLSLGTELADLVRDGIDVALRVGPLESSSLIARRIGTSRSALFASPAYLRRAGVPERPADLAGHACLSFRSTAPGPRLWRFAGGAAVAVEGPVRANSLSVLRRLAEAGCGIVLIPEWAAREAETRGALVRVLTDAPLAAPEDPVSAVYPAARHLPGKVRIFIDFLAKTLG